MRHVRGVIKATQVRQLRPWSPLAELKCKLPSSPTDLSSTRNSIRAQSFSASPRLLQSVYFLLEGNRGGCGLKQFKFCHQQMSVLTSAVQVSCLSCFSRLWGPRGFEPQSGASAHSLLAHRLIISWRQALQPALSAILFFLCQSSGQEVGKPPTFDWKGNTGKVTTANMGACPSHDGASSRCSMLWDERYIEQAQAL